jgi:hypothetical protein
VGILNVSVSSLSGAEMMGCQTSEVSCQQQDESGG